MTDRDTKIRERAYQLWIEEGQPEGRADRHWEEAARLVDEEGKAGAARDNVTYLAADGAANAATRPRRRAGRS